MSLVKKVRQTLEILKRLLTGNEAVARGAFESGVHFAAAYPGTPSSEILENITKYEEIISECGNPGK